MYCSRCNKGKMYEFGRGIFRLGIECEKCGFKIWDKKLLKGV